MILCDSIWTVRDVAVTHITSKYLTFLEQDSGQLSVENKTRTMNGYKLTAEDLELLLEIDAANREVEEESVSKHNAFGQFRSALEIAPSWGSLVEEFETSSVHSDAFTEVELGIEHEDGTAVTPEELTVLLAEYRKSLNKPELKATEPEKAADVVHPQPERGFASKGAALRAYYGEAAFNQLFSGNGSESEEEGSVCSSSTEEEVLSIDDSDEDSLESELIAENQKSKVVGNRLKRRCSSEVAYEVSAKRQKTWKQNVQ